MNWNEIGTGYFYPLEERKLSRRRTARFNTDIYVWSPLTGSPDLSATLEITVAICLAGNMYLNPLKAWIRQEGSRSWLLATLLSWHDANFENSTIKFDAVLCKKQFLSPNFIYRSIWREIHDPIEGEITIER